MPSPIFVAAIVGVEKLLRIDLDATQGPVSFVRQVLDRLPEGVPAFGKTAGFVINYSPDKAVRFDPNGQPIAVLDKAARPGTAVLLPLGGVRSLPKRWGKDGVLTVFGVYRRESLLFQTFQKKRLGISRVYNAWRIRRVWFPA